MKRIFFRLKHWEQWPFYVIYAPLGFMWLYYAIRARAFWFFSNVNPTLEFSGFEGENKKEMYRQLPEKYYPKTLFIDKGIDINVVEKQFQLADIDYPFVVKPQVGMQALLFRKIQNVQQLRHYHRNMHVDYMIQEFVELPMEFSVFHIRYPGEKKGKITGFILKEYLAVTGDGSSTLLQLIHKHSKAKYREKEMRQRHGKCLKEILTKGEKYYLSIAGNHNRGARFINLGEEIDERLCQVFDKISRESGHFYFGRYDLKSSSIEDLKTGKNFAILEYNGAGAEPNHIYDCEMSYWKALKTINEHWKDLYQIGRVNYKQGTPYWSFRKGYCHLRNAKKFFKRMSRDDLHFQFSSDYAGIKATRLPQDV